MTPRGPHDAAATATGNGAVSHRQPPAARLSEPLMTADDVAALLRVPRSTVYELARTRRIPYLKIGRRTLFEPASLREWIATRTVPPLR